ncbi:hypothetical protein Syun_005899 [Stephania yunnanensis]|uniref:R13L1/DRL21-like LRR repeat region domain-containing protein n=1 Tax=Stephania yunnanensis TaxID=152371 RepID=A0AAP0KX30_9MAGN
MHDLVHDLAQSVASPADQTAVLVDCIDKDDVLGSRRLQFVLTSEGTSSTTQVLSDFMSMIYGDRLRVLILTNFLFNAIKNTNISPLMKLKSLRVLILKDLVEELPDSIADLKQLRYLDLSESKIKALPESLNVLYNLQTLKLNSCFELEEIPCDITRKLINIRHLGMRYTSCQTPKEISQWKLLQTLSRFEVSKERGGGISELRFLNHLRDDLEIVNLENVENKEDAESANLIGKQKIRELAFTWSFDKCCPYINDDEVLEGLRPHSSLQSLTISNFLGSKFPTWLKNDPHMLPNLVEIRLEFLINCVHLPTFGSSQS